jgi:Glu-tRNA(Gln) amidotransferase subunit E-like FAD-binding protein
MIDYNKVGFRCGLEVHQQLETKKLFCNCPSLNIRDSKPDITFFRKLRAVAGETGEIDRAAQHEMTKSKTFIYEADSRDVCLTDIDEQPPNPINSEAVNIVLQVATLLKAKIVDEIQVMRKTVIDGSNVSGFQRTALVAYDGILETSKGNVRIPTICLEEEAAQKTDESKDYTKYRLDRLGIPLIEIATSPDIKDPEHAKETAEKLGMVLRSTGKVKRGLGTIRQDVNVSIENKNRVEIKGFQDIRSMPEIIEKEIQRQIKLKNKEEAHVRKVEEDGSTSFMRPMPGAARMYPETDVIPLKVDLSKIKEDIPELIEEKARRYEELGLGKDHAKDLAKSDKTLIFEKFVKEFKNIKPAFIYSTLLSLTKEIKRKNNVDTDKITEKQFEDIFKALNDEKISKNALPDILADAASGKLDLTKYKVESSEDIEKEITKIVKEKPGLNVSQYMGLVMAKFRGKIDGSKAMDILKKHVK